jgi:hypothetical protein
MHRTILNTSKQQWITIGVVVLAFVLLYFFFLRKKKAESSWNPELGPRHIPGPATPPIPPTNPKLELQRAQCKIGSCYVATIGFPKEGIISAPSASNPSGINAKQWWLFKNCLKKENVG